MTRLLAGLITVLAAVPVLAQQPLFITGLKQRDSIAWGPGVMV